MVEAHGVPEHDIGVAQRALRGDPLRHPLARLALRRILAARVALGGVVGGDPERLAGEDRAPPDRRVGRGHHRDGLAGDQDIRGRLAERVARRVVGDPPVAGGGRVDLAPALRLVGDRRRPRGEGVAQRVFRAARQRHSIHLVDRVRRAVHLQIEPESEEMLVVHRAQLRRDPMPRDLRLVVGDRNRLHDARRLDLVLPRAVLVEVPVEAVVVVVDGGEAGDDQPARAAHPGLRAVLVGVGVLPENADIFLMNADRVRNRARAAALVGQRRVEVGDLAQAVAAQLERVGHSPQAALAGVEGVFEVVPDRGVAVGHDHLRQRGAVANRPQAPAVFVADLVQHQPLARVQRDAHLPLLPGEQLPVERERRPLRLRDVERLEVLPRRAALLMVEAQRRRRGRRRRLVDHLQHAVRDQIDHRD